MGYHVYFRLQPPFFYKRCRVSMTKHRQQSTGARAKGIDPIWSHTGSLLPQLGLQRKLKGQASHKIYFYVNREYTACTSQILLKKMQNLFFLAWTLITDKITAWEMTTDSKEYKHDKSKTQCKHHTATIMMHIEDIRITEITQDVCHQAGPYRAFQGRTPSPHPLL